MDAIYDAISLGMGGYDMAHFYRHLFIVFCLFHLTMLFVFADFISGTQTAKKLKEPLRSHRYRKTIEKLLWYWGAQLLMAAIGLVGTMFDFYKWPYLSIFAALGICWIELKSMCEHAKRRKDHTSKIPEVLNELVDFVGGADEVKQIIVNAAKRKLED